MAWEYLQNILGPKGNTGDTGKPGTPGKPGEPGTDGFSPVASVEQTDDGATITITDKTHTSVANIKNGKNGAPGTPGKPGEPGTDGKNGATFTPTVSEVNGQYTMSWSNDGDLINPESVSWHNGADGSQGEQGPAGPGVAAGGTAGQKLVKKTDTDYDTEWVDDSAGGLPTGGRVGDVLVIGADNNPQWTGAVGYYPNPIGFSGEYIQSQTYQKSEKGDANYTFNFNGDGYGLLYNAYTTGTELSGMRLYKYYTINGELNILNVGKKEEVTIKDNKVMTKYNGPYDEAILQGVYYSTNAVSYERIEIVPDKSTITESNPFTMQIPYGVIAFGDLGDGKWALLAKDNDGNNTLRFFNSTQSNIYPMGIGDSYGNINGDYTLNINAETMTLTISYHGGNSNIRKVTIYPI